MTPDKPGVDNTARTSNPPNLTLYRCGRGHAFFYAHDVCPICRSALDKITRDPHASLVSHTTVRVSPTGSVFRLGLARTPDGAKTLCILDDHTDPDRNDDVIIVQDDGLFYALPGRSKDTDG